MKKALIILAVSLSLPIVSNAQARSTTRPVKKAQTSTIVKEAIAPPSANGKFKFISRLGFYNDVDEKKYVIISAPGKTAGEIKSSVMSSMSSMYSNPSKVISTLGDNIINVNGFAQNVFEKPFAGNTQYFSFSYNIRIEIKDGKIKLDAPNFSGITRREVYNGYTIDTRTVNEMDMLGDLASSDEAQQLKVTALFNAHINKIITGLSSSSDW